MSNHRKHVVVDFDNTLSGYDKWRGVDIIGPPIPYALDAMKEYDTWGWEIVVFTTRGNVIPINLWLRKYRFPEQILVNSSLHNPPGTSPKPIAEVYHDDRDAHVVADIPYNWHSAMSRVRKKYQPALDTHVDDAAAWASPWIRYFVAPKIRRQFARDLPILLDAEVLLHDGNIYAANALLVGLQLNKYLGRN